MTCETCDGTGFVTTYDDVGGDGGPRRPVIEGCPDCLVKGICPRCGGALAEAEFCLCLNCGFEIED